MLEIWLRESEVRLPRLRDFFLISSVNYLFFVSNCLTSIFNIDNPLEVYRISILCVMLETWLQESEVRLPRLRDLLISSANFFCSNYPTSIVGEEGSPTTWWRRNVDVAERYEHSGATWTERWPVKQRDASENRASKDEGESERVLVHRQTGHGDSDWGA
jgi:hypothetical protein